MMIAISTIMDRAVLKEASVLFDMSLQPWLKKQSAYSGRMGTVANRTVCSDIWIYPKKEM